MSHWGTYLCRLWMTTTLHQSNEQPVTPLSIVVSIALDPFRILAELICVHLSIFAIAAVENDGWW